MHIGTMGSDLSVVRYFYYTYSRNAFTTFAFVVLITLIWFSLSVCGKFLSNCDFAGLKIQRGSSGKMSLN